MKKGNIFFTILIIACIAFAVKNFGDDGGSTSGGDYGYSIDWSEPKDDSDSSSSSGNKYTGYTLPESRNMYKQLDSEEKRIYSEIRDGIAAGKSVIEIASDDYNRSVDALYQAYDAVYYDFPEFFWINGGWKCNGDYKNGGYIIYFEPMFYDYWQYTNDKSGYIEAVIDEAQRIASMAAGLPTDYDKVKFVHDYLVVNAEYDYVCLEEINKTVQRASSQQSHTVYGCLVNKVTVCDGYTKTFQLIMSMLGIEAEYCEGDAGGGHAWNYVILDGDEYWIDITWDENELEDEHGRLLAPNGANYDYFCVTDSKLYQTHTPEPDFKIPVCDSTEYNFFVHEKSELKYYDFGAVCTAIAEQNGAQIIHIRFGSNSELKKAIDDLVYNGSYRNIPQIAGKNPQFYSAQNGDTLHIYLQ